MFQDKFDLLLAPITLDNPVGEEVVFDYAINEIKNAREEYDSDIPMGVWETEHKNTDWNLVEKLCMDLLSKRSKDLQVLFWLIESWGRIGGFEGLTDGFDLTIQFIKKFDEKLYPHEFEGRSIIVAWFIDNMLLTMKKLPLYRNSKVSFSKFEKNNGENYGDTINQLIPKINSIKEIFEAFVKEPFSRMEELIVLVNQILNIIDYEKEKKVEKTVENAIDVKTTLTSIIPPNNMEQNLNTSAITMDRELEKLPQTIPAINNLLTSKEEAFEELLKIKKFLETIMSQSPIPIILDIAIRLKEKTFMDLVTANNTTDSIVVHISHLLSAINLRDSAELSVDTSIKMPPLNPVSVTNFHDMQFPQNTFDGPNIGNM